MIGVLPPWYVKLSAPDVVIATVTAVTSTLRPALASVDGLRSEPLAMNSLSRMRQEILHPLDDLSDICTQDDNVCILSQINFGRREASRPYAAQAPLR
ncbi:hypothetical protein EVAR_59116_1 [Eumeta japonica]|uniref:Uncharacterized protein n=1 Tax=Eumeta variegata TaxID=151549 RepID=A0A4C1ZHC2_EUMVA|nr:hypothetical protein EVAR_59116_1 [Eumeta japonica]